MEGDKHFKIGNDAMIFTSTRRFLFDTTGQMLSALTFDLTDDHIKTLNVYSEAYVYYWNMEGKMSFNH